MKARGSMGGEDRTRRCPNPRRQLVGREVLIGREAAHVGSDLGQDHLGGTVFDAGILSSSSMSREKGRVSSSIRSDRVAIVSSRKSIWASIWETSSVWCP